MHPDLQALHSRYTDLAGAANNGDISVEDATATLDGLSVTDATGAVWKMDVYGQFLRADFPGADPAPADPASFAADSAPPRESAYTRPDHPSQQHPGGPQSSFGGASPHESAPSPRPGGFGGSAPGDEATAPTSTPGGFGGRAAGDERPQPVTDPFASTEPNSPPGFGQGGFVGTDPFAGSSYDQAAPTDPAGQPDLFRPAKERPAKSLANAGMPGPFAARLLAVKNFVVQNFVVVAVAAIAIVLIVAFATGGDDGEQIPGNDPGAEAPADPGVPEPTNEPDPSVPDPEDPDPGVPDPSVALPTGEDVARLRKALTTGNRAAIARNVVADDPAGIAVAAALFAGLDQADLTLTTGPVGVDADGNVIGTWTLTGADTPDVTIPVTWVPVGDTFKLAAPPTP